MGNAMEKRMYTLRKGESPSSYLYIYLYFFFFSPVTIGRAETMASINRQEEEEEEKKKKKDFIYFFFKFHKMCTGAFEFGAVLVGAKKTIGDAVAQL